MSGLEREFGKTLFSLSNMMETQQVMKLIDFMIGLRRVLNNPDIKLTDREKLIIEKYLEHIEDYLEAKLGI